MLLFKDDFVWTGGRSDQKGETQNILTSIRHSNKSRFAEKSEHLNIQWYENKGMMKGVSQVLSSHYKHDSFSMRGINLRNECNFGISRRILKMY